MPDEDGQTKADKESLPKTPLHGYGEGRKEDISGDADALESTDPDKQQVGALEGDDELDLPHEKH